jgi:hypothetical protein
MTPVIQAALERLKAEDAWTHVGYDCPDLSSELADLITAVDALYPEGYDENGGLLGNESNYPRTGLSGRFCLHCGNNQKSSHRDDCSQWNARQSLLALCKKIAP